MDANNIRLENFTYQGGDDCIAYVEGPGIHEKGACVLTRIENQTSLLQRRGEKRAVPRWERHGYWLTRSIPRGQLGCERLGRQCDHRTVQRRYGERCIHQNLDR